MNDFRIVASCAGGPEVLASQSIEPEAPGPGEVRIRQRAVGVNFVDIYHRTGLYGGTYPAPLGAEAAGVIEAVGLGVEDLKVGDRVAYGTGSHGAYATVRLMPAEHVIRLPDAISDEAAAAIMLKGMTVAYLAGPCARIEPGQTVLVHAAAGGVGSILVPWLKALGARVIAHVGSSAKAKRVEALGADTVLSCGFGELAGAVRSLTAGDGAHVVFDGVGAASWTASMGATAACGLLVTYGNASGPVPPFTALDLMRAGSIFVTRPTLRDYAPNRQKRQTLAEALFTRFTKGDIPLSIDRRLALADAAEAHRALEARQTAGAIILLPE